MSIVKICGACFVFIISSLLFFKGKGSFGFFASLGMCLLVLVSAFDNLMPILDYANEISGRYGDGGGYIPLLLKVLGIGFISSALSGVCRDGGESSVASCVELFGKSEMLICALPVFKKLLDLGLNAI